jgi:hypothetical protein
MEDDEVWKWVPDYVGYYQVSDKGRVRSATRTVRLPSGQVRTYKGKFLQPWEDKHGYKIVRLCRDGITTEGKIHQLVLRAFIGPPPDGHICRHFPDQSPSNNNLNNLLWGTHEENSKDKVDNGTTNRGERCGSAKLTEEDVIHIRNTVGITNEVLATQYGVSQPTISEIKNRKTWAHIP